MFCMALPGLALVPWAVWSTLRVGEVNLVFLSYFIGQVDTVFVICHVAETKYLTKKGRFILAHSPRMLTIR